MKDGIYELHYTRELFHPYNHAALTIVVSNAETQNQNQEGAGAVPEGNVGNGENNVNERAGGEQGNSIRG